jgi:hypothetical protein
MRNETKKYQNFIGQTNGEKLTLTAWSKKIGIKENTLVYRLDVAKWPLEKALTQLNRKELFH